MAHYKIINGEAKLISDVGGGVNLDTISELINEKFSVLQNQLTDLQYNFESFRMNKSPENYRLVIEDVIDAADVVDIISGTYDNSKECVILTSGSTLEIWTLPYDFDDRPEKVRVTPYITAPDDATLRMYVCNNANDDNPIWEIYKPDSDHEFTNDTKTDDVWSVAAKIRIIRGTSNDEISISKVVTGVK